MVSGIQMMWNETYQYWTYGNGVIQETKYDLIGRVILITEWRPAYGAGREILRAEGYIYDDQGRRSHSLDEAGRVTKYAYDGQSRLMVVWYPYTEEKALADKREAEEAGLYFTPDKGQAERHSLTVEEQTKLREVLNGVSHNRGSLVSGTQMMWRETYQYDRNGNRAMKGTSWGIIRYEYDKENRLTKKGDIVYTYDQDGNLLREQGLMREAILDMAKVTGSDFGQYNVFTNNCVQYASEALAAGGVVTTDFFVPNIAHDFVIKNNPDLLIRDYDK
jgi:YD repeat-containing protein